jgi:hypothetical protein
MSFLGSLFDPVGALATGGNNNTFDSVFSPGDNLFGSQGLNVEPDFMNSFNSNVTEPVGSFADNVVGGGLDELKNLGNHFRSSPTQLLTGVDPAATKLWNGALGTSNKPWVDQWGGETKQDTQASANRGVNMEDSGYMSTLAHMISSYYAGGYLGNAAGAAYGGATAGAGAEGSAGSSALDVQAELAGNAAAGTGSSQAGYDASQIPGWTAGSGAGGLQASNAVSSGTRGAVNGGANALDNGSNPFKGAFTGAAQGVAGSNLDYAGGIGVEDPYAKSAINGGINGGVRAGMQDTDKTGYGAFVGALTGLAGKGAQTVGNYFTQPSSGDGGTQTGTTNFGNLATGLGNLWMAHQNNKGIQGQIDSLNSLYAPNSPYAKQMQEALDRQDAAGGRRSQYGSRAVQLQAALAGAASHNAPTLAMLYGQQRQNRFNQYAGMLASAKNSGAFNGLSGMFGQPTQPQQPYYQPQDMVNPSDMQMNTGTMSQDYSNILPGQIDPSQVYGG